jgi:hypothetical protein
VFQLKNYQIALHTLLLVAVDARAATMVLTILFALNVLAEGSI